MNNNPSTINNSWHSLLDGDNPYTQGMRGTKQHNRYHNNLKVSKAGFN
jgi:hypothetical protein